MKYYMGLFTEGIRVQCSATGAPTRLHWRDQWWVIAPEPQSWYRRRPWWETELRMPPGAGVGLVDNRIWQLNIQSDGQPDTDWLTLEVMQQEPGDRWRVIKIYDAVDETVSEDTSA